MNASPSFRLRILCGLGAACVVLLTTVLALPAVQAATTAYSFTQVEVGNVTHNTNSAYGFRFTVEGGVYANGIDILALGAFDYDTLIGDANGLNGPGFVADQSLKVWSEEGDLLGSGAIAAGNSNSNDFVYANIAPLHLDPGTYIITVYSDTPGTVRDGRLVFQSFAFAPGISWLAARDSTNTGDVFPANDGSATIFNGPNFVFEASSIPEPASGALLVFAGLAAVLRRRR